MKKVIIIMMVVLCKTSMSAQTLIRDVWAAMPEPLLPELTVNDRLDQIDFIDSNMQAKVRSRFGSYSVLDVLTDHYLHCTLTSKTSVEMRLLPATDSMNVVAVVSTAKTPVAVSHIEFYDTDWKPVDIHFDMPAVEQFADSIDAVLLSELADIPLVGMSLSADDTSLTVTISDVALSRDCRRALNGKLHPITLIWNEKIRKFVADPVQP